MTITLHHQTFPLREIEFDFGIRHISTDDLNKLIMDETGNYTSEEARMVDEVIFYYVGQEEIGLEDEVLRERILGEIG